MKFFLLDKQQNIIGRLSEEYILEATFTEEINTAGELLITLPAKKRLSGNVVHVLITNPSKDHSYLMFKIIKETVKDEEVEYTAVESAYDELASYGYIQDKRPTANAQTITEMILKDTRWHVGEIPDTSEAFISFYYLSVLDCLKKIVQTFDFEIGFDVLIDDDANQITDRRVNFYLKQGEQTGKRFEYGSNLLSIKQEQDTQNIYTALVGRGKGVQVSGGDDNSTPDGYGRRITFADVEWSKTNGDPLDKPKGQEWLEDPDATKQLGFSDGHMRIGLEVFEDVDDPKMLLQKTYEALKTAERPQVQFSASVINTGELHLGDRVGITRNDIGIAYETRVFKVQHNLLDETQNKIDLGDNLEQTNNLSYQVSALQSKVTNNTEGIITVTQSANGKNKVYYSSTMPATGSNGDVWYKDLGNGETEVYIYDNGWQLVISTENLHKIEDEVKQQQTALNQAVQDANTASAKADGLVAQVGDANTNAQNALATAQQNQEDLSLAKSQLSSVQTDLTSTKSSISQAQSDLKNTEQSLQGVQSDLTSTKQQMSYLTEQAQTQGQTIVNVQKTQSELSTSIADVKGDISSLQQTTDSLKSTITDANNNISAIKQTADGIENTVSNMRVGGTNLLRNTKLMNGEYWYSQQNPIQSYYQGIGVIHVNSDWWNARYFYKSLVKDKITDNTNDVFTFSCLVKRSSKDSKGDISFFCNAVNVISTHIDQQAVNENYWTQIWVTFKFKPSSEVDSSNDYGNSMRFEQGGTYGETLYTMFKLERGNVPTAYNPAPQDIDGDISTVSQKADSIESIVKSNSGDISSLKQTAQGLQGSISDNKNDIADIKATAQGLQTSVENNKKNISNIQQTADSLQSTITNNSNDISSLKQTATGLQSTVSNMKASSENLLPNTLDFAGWQQGGQGSMDNAKDDNTLTNAWHAWGDNNSAWIGSPQTKPVYLSAGIQYTFSAVCWNNGSSTGNNFDDDDVELYFNNNDNSKAYNHQLTGKTNKDHIRYSVTFTVDDDGLYWGFKVVDMSGFIGGSLWSAEYMLVEGNIATAYQPSSTAMAMDISTIQQTIDGVKIDIANSNGDISSLKQRADSIETNISNNSNDISQLKQTANSLQSNIQSKADISQITQLSNAVQSVVQSVGSFFPNGNFADSNVQVYWSPWDITKDYTNISYDAATYNGSYGNLCLHAANGGCTKAISTEYIPVQPGKSVTISLSSRGDWYNSNNGKPKMLKCYVHFYDSKKNETEAGSFDLNCNNNHQWYDNSVTYGCNSNECYIRIEIILQGNQENWAHITNVKVSSDGGESISSKISQMADDINMRVQKGDLLSQINIQAGSMLIQSNKLYLDASSVVFSGNAFIPSAAITDLSADKITAGTLNAGNVNIINLDVNKLVGNTTEFVRSGWTNAYGSHVQIDGTGMAITYGNWWTKFEPDGMAFRDGNQDIGGFTTTGMNGAPDWYSGLLFNAGGDAEFLSIGAKDYGNDSQNPVPVKLIWMRDGIDGYGYRPGWNFCDKVWAGQIGMSSIQYQDWNIHFEKVTGDNGFSALTLVSGSGNGFYWGSDGSFGYVTGHGGLHNVQGSQIIYNINQNGGTCENWSGVN